MITEILLLTCTLIFLYLSYHYAVARPEGYPPGPPKVPIFGSYLYMMLSNFKYMHKGVQRFTKWYKSDIVGFYFGPYPTVAVHSPEGIREMLNNSDFDGRPGTYLAKMRHPELRVLGIFFHEGPQWKEQRRFILRFMRDYGFGRRFEQLELVIQEDISDMLDMIRNGPRYEHEHLLVKKGGYRVCLPHLFNPFSLNSLLHVMINERRSRAELADLVEVAIVGMVFQRHADDYGKMLSIIPWVRKVFPKLSSYDVLMKANRHLYKFFGDIIDRHMATYDESAERNFVDMYIREMKNAEKLGDTESSYQRDQFIMSLIDFSFPAFTAVGSQISLLIQYLMLYPEVLKRIQKEIDEVVGSGRLPCLEDRKNMPFTEATIREGMRIETLVPSGVPHKTLVDTQLMGYKIPKDTVVMPILYAYHTDPRVWGDPENFRPERFLDEDGNLCLKKDISMPFGAGKRLCAGETFGRNMLFLMTSALCQNFNFVLAPGDEMPDLSKTLSGLIISPPDFWLQLEERT